MQRAASALAGAIWFGLSVPSSAFTIATWNAEQGSVETVTRRDSTLRKLGDALRTNGEGKLPDVLVLQEITSYAAAARIAGALGYGDATLAVSDAGNDREIWPFALEVAIIATRPVVNITSYQSRADERFPPFRAVLATGDVTYGQVEAVNVPAAVALRGKETIPRAILRVEIEGGIVIYGVHLNSSGLGFCRIEDAIKGARDLVERARALELDTEAKAIEKAINAVRAAMTKAKNPGIEATKQEALRRARSREAAAGAIAQLAANDTKVGKSVFVAGDFNTPLYEACKTGDRLDQDTEPMMGCATKLDASACSGKDGFDDTYAVLTKGLIENVRFRVLTDGIGRTYAKGDFVDSPIDNVLVAGPAATAAYAVKKIIGLENDKPFGSDHFPVIVRKAP
ncbi:MAG: endonuclease/exonuclease/phosphatase family protein [Hyphomicrobiaceae bacterium]